MSYVMGIILKVQNLEIHCTLLTSGFTHVIKIVNILKLEWE